MIGEYPGQRSGAIPGSRLAGAPREAPALTARLLFGLVNSVSEWYRPRPGDDGAAVADAVCTLVFGGIGVVSSPDR